MVRRIDELAARGRRRRSSCSTRPCRSGSSARRCELPYDVVLHGAEVTVPGRLPGHPAGARQRAAPGPPRRVGRASTRPPRPSGPPAGRCRSPSCRPASTSSASARSTDAERRRRPRPLRPARRRRAGRVDLPARAAQGLRRRHRGGRRCWRRARPDLVLAIAGGGRDERRLRRLAAELGAPVRFLGRVANDDLPRCTAAPTCSPCCAATGGAGSSRRASASCSSRPRRAACRRSPVTRAGRPRRSSTASPASSCAGRTTSASVAAAFDALLDDDAAASAMARGVARAGRRRVLLRRARPSGSATALGRLTT